MKASTMNDPLLTCPTLTDQVLLQLVISSPNGIFVTDETGIVTLWNPALEQLSGIAASEAQGEYIWDVQHRFAASGHQTPEVYHRRRAALQELLRVGTTAWSGKSFECWTQRGSRDRQLVQATIFAFTTACGFQLAGVLRDVTADHHTLNQLRILTQAVEQSPLTVLITDQDGIIEYGNPPLTELTGYTLDEVRGSTPRMFQSGLTPPEIYQQLWNTIKNGQTWHGELQNRRKNGDLFWENISISPVFDEDNTIQHFVAVIEDITERKQAEQELRESEDRFRATFEQVAVGIAHVAPDGRFLRINQKFCDLVGYSRAEMTTKTFQDITHPDDLALDMVLVQRMLNREVDHYTMQKRYIRKDQTPLWVELTVVLAWHDDGTPKYFISVVQDISERRQAEQALRESEERFRILVTSTDDIIFTLDPQHRHTGVFGSWLAKNQLTPQHFLGKTAREIMGDEASEVHKQANDRALRGESVVYEWSVGRQVIQTSLSPLVNEAQQVTGLVGIGRDVTALKQVEEQLRESERFARSTFNSLTAEIAILDETGTIITVNESWRAFARANSAHPGRLCEGMNYLEVLAAVEPDSEDKASASAFEAGIRSVMAGERDMFSLEYPCHSPAEQRWFMGRVTRFIGDGPLRLVIAHENITERKLAEITIQQAHQQLEALHEAMTRQNVHLEQMVSERTAQLRRLNDRMSTILDNTSDAIILINDDVQLENSNLSFDRLFGYERDEIFGAPIGILVDKAAEPILFDAIEMARTSLESQRIQLTARRKDGRTFDADIALAYVKDNGGHTVCSVRDITHLKEIERVKDQFLSTVSHELRTPVSAIMLSSETMSRYYSRLSDQQKLHKLNQIHQQSATLTELVTAILDTARFDARRGKTITESIDLVKTLHQVLSEMRPQAEANHQQLQADVPDTPLLVFSDNTDITRVWRNLIGNAIKYTGEGGNISAGIYSTGQAMPDSLAAVIGSLPLNTASHTYAVGVVADNGPGIRDKDLPQLFSRFFRGWAAGTSIPGTGLGLSLVKDILQSYGGDITVRSELNAGTTFYFWLPIAKGSSE